MTAQVETRTVTLVEVMRHDLFAEGYAHVMAGRRFDPDCGGGARDQWFYERGRAVAAAVNARHGRVLPLYVDNDLGSVINPRVIEEAVRSLL